MADDEFMTETNDDYAAQQTSPATTNATAGASSNEAGLSENQANSRLKSLIERIERLEEEKKNLAEDIRDVYAEAKSQGYDVKVLRKVISIRKKDPDKQRMEDEILQLYLSALGM